MRRFAADSGAPGALAMTAADLEAAGLVAVGGVVAGYQQPQFMTPAGRPTRRRRSTARRGDQSIGAADR